MEESAVLINSEGGNPTVFGWCTSDLDNWTDSMMMLFASNNKEDALLNRSLLDYYGIIDSTTPSTCLEEHFVNKVPYDCFGTYSRYWHGYMLILRPFLSFFSYHKIRIINGIIQTILTLLVLLMLHKRHLNHLMIPYLISVCMLMPIVVAKSLQFSSCFYVFSASSLIILFLGSDLSFKKNFIFEIIFLLTGIATSFIDFLTYPISTFGIPMIIYISLCKSKQLEELFSLFIKNGLSWFFGYIGMWICKWVLANLVTDVDVIAEGIENVINRTSNEGWGKIYSLIETEYQNIRAFFKTPATLFALLLIAVVIIMLFKSRKKICISNDTIYKQIYFYVFIGLLPIFWYAALLNHSAVHTFFTNKSCVVLVFSLLASFSTMHREMKQQKLLS